MENQEDMTDEWDPMRQDAESYLCFGFSSRYEPSALAIGGIQAEGDYSSISQVPCEFHNGNGTCFKGRHCVKNHPIGEGSGIPLVLERTIHHASQLPYRLNHEPASDVQFLGKVCSIKSPLEFHIIPKVSVGCLCGCDKQLAQNPDFEDDFRGLLGLDKLDIILNEYMKAKKHRFQMPEYQKRQLVAVRCQVQLVGMAQSRLLQWYRGIVLKGVAYNNNPYEPTTVSVQLLDFGPAVVAPLHQVACLPAQFVRIAPLAFKCDLKDIIPVGPDFSAEAVAHFMSLVKDKELIVTLKSRKLIPSTTETGLRDNFLYSVELDLKPTLTPEDLREDVADEFKFDDSRLRRLARMRRDVQGIRAAMEIDREAVLQRHMNPNTRNISQLLYIVGHCLIPHPFPHRPMLLQTLPLSLSGAQLLAHETDYGSKEDQNRNKKLLAKETERVYHHLERQDPCDASKKDIGPLMLDLETVLNDIVLDTKCNCEVALEMPETKGYTSADDDSGSSLDFITPTVKDARYDDINSRLD